MKSFILLLTFIAAAPINAPAQVDNTISDYWRYGEGASGTLNSTCVNYASSIQVDGYFYSPFSIGLSIEGLCSGTYNEPEAGEYVAWTGCSTPQSGQVTGQIGYSETYNDDLGEFIDTGYVTATGAIFDQVLDTVYQNFQIDYCDGSEPVSSNPPLVSC